MNGATGTSWSMPMICPSAPPFANRVMTPYAALTESRFMIAAFSEISGERNATSRSRNESPTTPAMNSGIRPFMYSLWSSSAAVTPPTSARTSVSPIVCGMISSRIRLTRSSVAGSCGEVVGMTVTARRCRPG